MVRTVDLLLKYLGTRSFDWPRGNFCLNSLFPAHQSQTKYFRKTFRQMYLWPHQLQKTNDKKSNLCCMKKRDCSTDANMKTVRANFLTRLHRTWVWWTRTKKRKLLLHVNSRNSIRCLTRPVCVDRRLQFQARVSDCDWWAGNKELWWKPSQDHLKVNFCLARSPEYGERSGKLELFERQRLCLPSLVSFFIVLFLPEADVLWRERSLHSSTDQPLAVRQPVQKKTTCTATSLGTHPRMWPFYN